MELLTTDIISSRSMRTVEFVISNFLLFSNCGIIFWNQSLNGLIKRGSKPVPIHIAAKIVRQLCTYFFLRSLCFIFRPFFSFLVCSDGYSSVTLAQYYRTVHLPSLTLLQPLFLFIYWFFLFKGHQTYSYSPSSGQRWQSYPEAFVLWPLQSIGRKSESDRNAMRAFAVHGPWAHSDKHPMNQQSWPLVSWHHLLPAAVRTVCLFPSYCFDSYFVSLVFCSSSFTNVSLFGCC